MLQEMSYHKPFGLHIITAYDIFFFQPTYAVPFLCHEIESKMEVNAIIECHQNLI